MTRLRRLVAFAALSMCMALMAIDTMVQLDFASHSSMAFRELARLFVVLTVLGTVVMLAGHALWSGPSGLRRGSRLQPATPRPRLASFALLDAPDIEPTPWRRRPRVPDDPIHPDASPPSCIDLSQLIFDPHDPRRALHVTDEALEVGLAHAPSWTLPFWATGHTNLYRSPHSDTLSELCLEAAGADDPALEPLRVRFLWPTELVDPSLPIARHDDAPWIAPRDVLQLRDALLEAGAVRLGFAVPDGTELNVDPARLHALFARAELDPDAALSFLPEPDFDATLDAPMAGNGRGSRLRLGADALELTGADGAVTRIDLERPFAAVLSTSLDEDARQLLHCEVRQQAADGPGWARIGFTCTTDDFATPVTGVPQQPRDFGHLTEPDARLALARIRAAMLDHGDASWGVATDAQIHAEATA